MLATNKRCSDLIATVVHASSESSTNSVYELPALVHSLPAGCAPPDSQVVLDSEPGRKAQTKTLNRQLW